MTTISVFETLSHEDVDRLAHDILPAYVSFLRGEARTANARLNAAKVAQGSNVSVLPGADVDTLARIQTSLLESIDEARSLGRRLSAMVESRRGEG